MADTIKNGSFDITSFKVGSDDCKIYLGDTLLYPQSQPQEKNYLRIKAANTATFTFIPKGGVASGNTISYSSDGGTTWRTQNNFLVSAGSVYLLKGENFGISNNGIGTFSASTNFDVEGNIMSLLYGDDFEGKTDLTGKDYAFMNLFSGCTNVIDASNLVLPATTLSRQCYCNMFNTATKLQKAPSVLPAMTLGVGCYMNMFSRCSAMTSVMDELPATTLSDSAYTQMFYECRVMTKAPMLPANVVPTYGYYRMFYNAKKLNKITTLALDKSAYNANGSWVYGVASSGTFIKHKDMTQWSNGSNGIPNGWTVQNYSG